ncbi:MAG: hypothetical protein ACREAS_04800 [Nitrososphaera sp.]
MRDRFDLIIPPVRIANINGLRDQCVDIATTGGIICGPFSLEKAHKDSTG